MNPNIIDPESRLMIELVYAGLIALVMLGVFIVIIVSLLNGRTEGDDDSLEAAEAEESRIRRAFEAEGQDSEQD